MKPSPGRGRAGLLFARGSRHAAGVQRDNPARPPQPAFDRALQPAPATGGRLDVRLVEADGVRARFRVELATPEGRWSGEAEVAAADGRVELAPWTGTGEPPGWLCQYLHAGLRGAWRQRATQGWPRRFTRWREERDADAGSPPE